MSSHSLLGMTCTFHLTCFAIRTIPYRAWRSKAHLYFVSDEVRPKPTPRIRCSQSNGSKSALSWHSSSLDVCDQRLNKSRTASVLQSSAPFSACDLFRLYFNPHRGNQRPDDALFTPLFTLCTESERRLRSESTRNSV